MKKRSGLLVLFLFLFGWSPSLIQAEYVDECFENPEQCEEEEILEEQEEDETELLLQEEDGSSLFFELIKLFFALLLVVGLIYAFLYFLRKNKQFGSPSKNLESMGGISLGQNKSIQLIRLGDRIYMVGVGEDITLLEEVKDETMVQEILKEKEEQAQDWDASKLLDVFSPKKKEKKEEEENFKPLFQQELNRLEKNRKSMIDKHKEED